MTRCIIHAYKANLSQAERVLVVERVIESLGLQHVRNSLVGTVEKRGISGGQRKRVNVGLEMVMEPSLLILDEPTSGLDSSSSQLLLKALRREAHEAVNVCMVVHQPRMFDDLILLAKGGLIAYLGPVKNVEEYFSGIGIHVPERVNPPDHYIDILEGIVKSNTTSTVNYKELPVMWMRHNGYPIPLDMKDSEVNSDSSREGSTSTVGASHDQSFAGELWQEFKLFVQLKNDNFLSYFTRRKDLSGRVTPGVCRQYRYFLGRVAKQRIREARLQAVDFLLLLIAGISLGTLAKVSDENFGAVGYTYTIIAFYNYIVLLCLLYCVSGIAYALAIYLGNRVARAGWSVLLPVVLTLVSTQDDDKGTILPLLKRLAYPSWALEAFVLANAERYRAVWLLTRCAAIAKRGYDLRDWKFCLMHGAKVDAYESIYAALENEVLKLEHFYPDCLYVTNNEAFASSFLDADIAENGLLVDTLGEPIEGLADVGDNFPDICEDDLLDIIKDETSMPHTEKNDTTRDDEKDMVLKTPELDPLARIFRFKTKPRAKNFKRSTPKTYDNFKSISEVGDILLSLSDMREERSIDEKSSWCKLREYRDESLDRMWNQDDDNGETKARTDKKGRKQRLWSVPEVLKLDKWRNLLAASCKSAHGKVRGEYASQSHDILRRIRELSEIHPYPRNQQQKMKEFKTESSSSSKSEDNISSSPLEDNISAIGRIEPFCLQP
ncbi:ABC transporter G family member 28-like protein [Tanacetum coccineum]